MIYLFHGADSFQIHRAVNAIKQRLGLPPHELEQNTENLDGATLTPLELMQHATALAFLSPARLVIVDGLVAAVGSQMAGRGRKKAGVDDPLEPWKKVLADLGREGVLPESTTLVFLEGDLVLDRREGKRMSPALSAFQAIAQTTEFEAIKDREVASWVREELKGRDGLKMNERAIAVLVETVGPDLWALYNELDKLETYAQGEPIDEKTVAAVVAQARETKLWDLADAVVAGGERKAVGTLRRLLDEGDAAPMLASLIAGQYRQLAIVKELSEKRATEAEISRAARMPGWKVKQVAATASKCTWADLRRAYALLVDADLSVKRGLQDDESALQLLVHELCSIATKPQARGRAGVR